MNKGKIFSLIMPALSLFVIVGGWFLTDKLVERKENRILGQKGQITVQSAKKQNKDNDLSERAEEINEPFTGRKMTENEMVQVLTVWETGGKEIPHEPLKGQMSMEQAVAKGREWMDSMAEKKVLFSSAAVQAFDKTTAKLCTFDDEAGTPKEIISFWEVIFQKSDVKIVLKIHALSGEVWAADIGMVKKNVTYHGSAGELLDAAFSFQEMGNRVFKKNNIYYRQNKAEVLNFIEKKSDYRIDKQMVARIELWIATEIEDN